MKDTQTYHKDVLTEVISAAAKLKTRVSSATEFYYSDLSVKANFYKNIIIPMLEIDNFPKVGTDDMVKFVKKVEHNWIVESGIN